MNVPESNTIIDQISFFRQNIYNTDLFKNTLSSELKRLLDIDIINFIPDQYGGWVISVSSLSKEFNKDLYFNYYTIINNSLIYSIQTVNKSIDTFGILNNISEIIISGSNSFIIKI